MSEKLFPVLELEMNQMGMRIRLADEQSSLVTALPKEMMEGIVVQWQAYQRGESGTAYSRHYTGNWPGALRKE